MIPPTVFDHFFTAGGLGMYPISICGFLLVAAGVLLALRPERRFVGLVVTTGLMTLGSGVLSSLTGLANLLHYLATVPPDRRVEVAIVGTAEASHCMMFAMMFVQAAFWLAGIAALRAARTRGSTEMTTETASEIV